MMKEDETDAHRYGQKVRIDFSTNICPHARLEGLQQHLSARMDSLFHNPEIEPNELEGNLSEFLAIPRECLMVTRDSKEAIYLLAQLFRDYASIIPQPTCSLYVDACRLHQHIISYEKTEELTHLKEERLYWLCNPNIPSGNVLMKGFMDYVVRANPQYIYIVDQTYENYTREPLFTPNDVQRLTNLVQLHSLSVQYAVPGLRLSYITACPSIIARLHELRQPWTISPLTVEAGLWLLQHGQDIVPNLDDRLAEAARLRESLAAISGVRMFESKCTFMLGCLNDIPAADLHHYLLHQHGILIRDCSTFEGLNSDFFSVASQTPEENDELVQAIKQFMEDKK